MMTLERYLVVLLSPRNGMRSRKWCRRATPIFSMFYILLALPINVVYRGTLVECTIQNFVKDYRSNSFDAFILLYNAEVITYISVAVIFSPSIVTALVFKIIAIEKKRLARDGESDSVHIRIALELLFFAIYMAICVSLNLFWLFQGKIT